MNLVFAEPTEWWLELSPTLQTECWQRSQSLTSPTRIYQSYLNQLCLHTFLPWFQAEYASETRAWLTPNELFSIWEVVNGIRLLTATTQLVLIPTDTLDSCEFNVPQEWIDIPNWAADYYLAVQLNPEAGWLRVWGHTTHHSLKQHAHYDQAERTYCLPAHRLNRDLTTFWQIHQLCPTVTTKASIAALSALSAGQAEQFIQQVSQPEALLPRTTLPFHLWGALLASKDWRQQLHQRRLAHVRTESRRTHAPVSLSNWFQNVFETEWQSLETFSKAHILSYSYRIAATDVNQIQKERIKFITLNAESEPQTVVLLLALKVEFDGRVGVQVQVHPVKTEPYVPANLALEIYSESDERLKAIKARHQENYIRLPQFRCLPRTQFRLQVVLNDAVFSETFQV